jgi:hypothetical protein
MTLRTRGQVGCGALSGEQDRGCSLGCPLLRFLECYLQWTEHCLWTIQLPVLTLLPPSCVTSGRLLLSLGLSVLSLLAYVS